MKIRCNDGYFRRIMPSQGVGAHLKVTTAHTTRAYCEECREEFRAVETKLQIEDWRKHECSIGRLKRVM